MLGGLFAYLTGEVRSIVGRKVTIIGILAVGRAFVVFAGGYALDAVHSAIAYRWGPTRASLVIAGTLVVLAVICIIVAKSMQARSGSSRRPVHEERVERPIEETRQRLERRRSLNRAMHVAGTFAGSAVTGIAGAFALRRLQGGYGRLRGWFRR